MCLFYSHYLSIYCYCNFLSLSLFSPICIYTHADVGLSLSEREASLAAPFTSTIKSIQSVIDVMREGRAALTCSIQSFKFVMLYALIQVITVSILHCYGGNLTDSQYLWIDLVVVLPLALAMPWTGAAVRLSSRMPTRRLIGLAVIMSILGQVRRDWDRNNKRVCLFNPINSLVLSTDIHPVDIFDIHSSPAIIDEFLYPVCF